MSVSQTTSRPKHVKSATVNAIRNAADKRLAAEFALRRIELAAKLDAIFAAKRAAPDGTLQDAIDYGAELLENNFDAEEWNDYFLDQEWLRSGL